MPVRNLFGSRPALSAAKTELEGLLVRVERSGDAKPYEVLLHKSLATCHQFLSLRLLEAQSCLSAGNAAAATVPNESERPMFSVSLLHLDAIPFYQRAMKIFANHPLVRCVNFSLYFDLATLMLEKGERKEAAHILEQSLRLPPSQGATEFLTQATLQELFELSLRHLEFTRAYGALKQLVSLLSVSKSLMADHYLADAQISLVLLQLQQRDLNAAKRTLADLTERYTETPYGSSPILMHISTLVVRVSSLARYAHLGRSLLHKIDTPGVLRYVTPSRRCSQRQSN